MRNPCARNRFKEAFRKKRATQLYLEGYAQFEIAIRLGVTQAAVSKIIKRVKKEWQTEVVTNTAAARNREIARLENIYKVAIKAWKRSKRNAESESISKEYARLEKKMRKLKGRGDGKRSRCPLIVIKKKSDRKTMGQSGDPRFLYLAKECIETIAKIRGILEPETNNTQITVLQVPWEQLSRLESRPSDVIEGKIASVRNLPVERNGDHL